MEPHGKEIDYWALGVILYELLTGNLPFSDLNLDIVFEQIKNVEIKWPMVVNKSEIKTNPGSISNEAYELLKGLLERDPKKRLGANGLEEIKKLRFFEDIDFNEARKRVPEHVPKKESMHKPIYFPKKIEDILNNSKEFDKDVSNQYKSEKEKDNKEQLKSINLKIPKVLDLSSPRNNVENQNKDNPLALTIPLTNACITRADSMKSANSYKLTINNEMFEPADNLIRSSNSMVLNNEESDEFSTKRFDLLHKKNLEHLNEQFRRKPANVGAPILIDKMLYDLMLEDK